MKKNIIPKTSILVVEDELPLLNAVTTKLRKAGFSTVSARDCTQAINYFNDGVDINCVWLDHYLLGKKTGLDLVAFIKENSKYIKIPIFVVTNTAGPDKKQIYLELGVNKYYVKSNHRLDEIINDIKITLKK